MDAVVGPGILYELPCDPQAVREERQRIDFVARKRAGRTFSACFLPVFFLVRDRVIACTGSSGYQSIGSQSDIGG
jgi:hypothetical protein